MELNIQPKNLSINEQVRNHIERKLNQLNRHLPSISRALVEVASQPTRSQQDRIVAQVTLSVGRTVLRAEQRATSTTEAINAVADVLDRRIERYKSSAYRSERSRQNTTLPDQQIEDEFPSVSDDQTELLPGGNLVRVKQFDMKPLSVEEAAFQMQLLGHSFFMFLNSESKKYSLLYQRDDGNFGMIQPKSV